LPAAKTGKSRRRMRSGKKTSKRELAAHRHRSRSPESSAIPRGAQPIGGKKKSRLRAVASANVAAFRPSWTVGIGEAAQPAGPPAPETRCGETRQPHASTTRVNHTRQPHASTTRVNHTRQPHASTTRVNHTRQPHAPTTRANHTRQPHAPTTRANHTRRTGARRSQERDR
jgi:hypothetical protein